MLKRLATMFMALVLCFGLGYPAQAQAVTSNVATVSLTATVGETITVSVTNGSTFAFGSNGVLAPPLIVLVVLLTSDSQVMGEHVNSRLLRSLGWLCAAVMTAAAIAMFVV